MSLYWCSNVTIWFYKCINKYQALVYYQKCHLCLRVCSRIMWSDVTISPGNISTKQYIDIKALYYICSRYFYMLWKVCSWCDGCWSTDPNTFHLSPRRVTIQCTGQFWQQYYSWLDSLTAWTVGSNIAAFMES